MKYSELIQFEPITEVVKFQHVDSDDQALKQEYRASLVRNYVFSKTTEANIAFAVKMLDFTSTAETFGLQIVGDYGTGKSHMMSIFSLIAENADLLPLVRSENARKALANIAGKYKVVRFELGSSSELWDLVCYQIDKRLKELGVNYSIADDKTPDMYADKLKRMMAHFDAVYPDKGLMLVIDEMLSYLKGRSGNDALNRDLAVLQALGQASDKSRFRMVFGVQKRIYTVPEFQFAAEMLNHANDRYKEITITKEDVEFVVQQRLLKKTEAQKEQIRAHLGRFTSFFTDLSNNFEEYVNLFPVNPSFFDNFQQIKIAKAQREVLKTLTSEFDKIKHTDVPDSEPGLICYDCYWEDLSRSENETNPDIRRVSGIMDIVNQKIEENFTGLRAKKLPLAHRIANACAIKILQADLQHTNGVTAETLIDDLAYLAPNAFDRDFLRDTIETTAKQIVSSTVGQYFERNDQNQEFHLRIQGGVNYEQKIKDFALTLSDDIKDSYFFDFLIEFLPVASDQYKREFKIFPHHLEWNSHKVMLDGYIFFGHPNERSTAQPEQYFYIYFMPIFNHNNMQHGAEPDSVFFHLDKINNEFKELMSLYAAALSLEKSEDSSQKPFYKQYADTYKKRLKDIFNTEFSEVKEVYYKGELQAIPPMSGDSKDQIVDSIASRLLEEYFCGKLPEYPAFTLLRSPMTSNNRPVLLKGARQKIANPSLANREAEAVLAGLGLINDNQLSTDACLYAQIIRDKLEAKGPGQVLNRNEILYQFWEQTHTWRMIGTELDADFTFLVLSAMVALGQIDIALAGGKVITATSLPDIVNLSDDQFYSFTHIRQPKGINIVAVKELFLGITGHDYSANLQDEAIYQILRDKASALARQAVVVENKIKNGLKLDGIEILPDNKGLEMGHHLQTLAGFCDQVQTYTSYAKMRNLRWSVDEIKHVLEYRKDIKLSDELLKFRDEFKEILGYLNAAVQYMTDPAMKQETEEVIGKFSDVVAHLGNETAVRAYRDQLESLRERYADWYLAEYHRLHINAIELAKKNRILASSEKQILQAMCGADDSLGFSNLAARFDAWTRKINQLTVAGNVSKQSVLSSPYQAGFNPQNYAGKELPELSDLQDELNTLYADAAKALENAFADPQIKKNLDSAIDASERALVERYQNGAEEVSPTNINRLLDALSKLQKGTKAYSLTPDLLANHVFTRPMTPSEATRAFNQYIKDITAGQDPETVRIIFKNK